MKNLLIAILVTLPLVGCTTPWIPTANSTRAMQHAQHHDNSYHASNAS